MPVTLARCRVLCREKNSDDTDTTATNDYHSDYYY